MSDKTSWSKAAERGSMLGLRVTVACYRWFGRPLSLVLVHAIVAYFFLTGRAQRRASLAYLRRVASAPEPQNEPVEDRERERAEVQEARPGARGAPEGATRRR